MVCCYFLPPGAAITPLDAEKVCMGVGGMTSSIIKPLKTDTDFKEQRPELKTFNIQTLIQVPCYN